MLPRRCRDCGDRGTVVLDGRRRDRVHEECGSCCECYCPAPTDDAFQPCGELMRQQCPDCRACLVCKVRLLLADLMVLVLELGNGGVDVLRRSQHDGVEDQAERAELVLHPVPASTSPPGRWRARCRSRRYRCGARPRWWCRPEGRRSGRPGPRREARTGGAGSLRPGGARGGRRRGPGADHLRVEGVRVPALAPSPTSRTSLAGSANVPSAHSSLTRACGRRPY